MILHQTPLRPSQNQLKKWARLNEAKFRREEGLFLVEGVKVVGELLKTDWEIEAILTLPEKRSFWEKIMPDFVLEAGLSENSKNAPVYELTRTEWKKISQDKEPEGLMAVVLNRQEPPLPSWLKSAGSHLLIGHAIANPQNLGALIRSAHWFGFAGILLGPYSVDWTNPKVIRASMGSIFHLTVFQDVDLNVALSVIKEDYVLIGSEVRQGLAPHPLNKKAALLLGSESHGLPEDLLEQVDERWRIPGSSKADSLSLPQAAAIMMYEVGREGC